MKVTNCSKADFDHIITNINDFWGSDRTLHLHHPILINEFGNTAFVIKDENADSTKVYAYLFGFYSQAGPVDYVHLLAVRNGYRKLGLGRWLYEHFIRCARDNNCLLVKAITKTANADSIAFHRSIGMKMVGNDVLEGMNVVLDYSGPGEHRVVFTKDI